MRTSLRSLASFLAAGFLAGLPWSATPAAAQIDTVEVWPGPVGLPAVASVPVGDLAPPYGVVHLAYTRSDELRHAWKFLDTWEIETVAPSAVSWDIAVDGDGLASIAFADAGGRLIFARRSPVAWDLDTLAAFPGSTLHVSLARGHADPAIACLETPSGGPDALRYAWWDGSSWNLTTLDPAAGISRPASIAIDFLGRPKLAYVRSAPTSSGFELVLLEGASSSGPFTPSVVDSQCAGVLAMTWDRFRERPFLSYLAQLPSGAYEYRVAHRDEQGDWRYQVLGYPAATPSFALAIGLDPVGAVGTSWVQTTPIAPGSFGEGHGCGSVDDASVQLSRLPAGVPMAPLATSTLPVGFGVDAVSGRRAVSAHRHGTFDVAWRSPRVACPPYAIHYGEFWDGTTSVPVASGRERADLELAPSPRRGAAPLRVRWTQQRSAVAGLELHDLAGRVVAVHDAAHREAGVHEMQWNPGALRPGLYWVTLRLDGRRISSRVLVSR